MNKEYAVTQSEHELLEKCEKGDCICDNCKRRFICFTQKRVFSDPTYQALYEVYMDQGMPHEDAVKAVKDYLESLIKREKAPPNDWDRQQRWVKEWDTPQKTPKWSHNKFYYQDLEKAIAEMEKLKVYFKDVVHGKSQESKMQYL